MFDERTDRIREAFIVPKEHIGCLAPYGCILNSIRLVTNLSVHDAYLQIQPQCFEEGLPITCC